jgi:ATP-dependent Clp protease ATP-binding subunit ClpB
MDNVKSALELYAIDYTKLAIDGKLDPVIGRDKEIRRVIQILGRRSKNNPVLVGPPGTGKTAIVEGLAQRIISNDVPESLKNASLYFIDVAAILAGAKYRGEFEERFKAILSEITSQERSVVTFIDEIHTIVGAGAMAGAMDAGNMLKPMLARGELRMIGATTFDEYREFIEKDSALERRFQKILVDEPSVEESLQILRGLKDKYELHHKVTIDDEALLFAVTASKRYITERFLPDKAIDLLDEACSKVRTEIDSSPEIIDTLQRRLSSLQMEVFGLGDIEKESSKRNKLREEIHDISDKLRDLIEKWRKDKERLDNITSLTSQIDEKRLESERLQREGKFEEAAKILYRDIKDLESKIIDLKSDSSSEDSLVKDSVGVDEIASVLSAWTGIATGRLKDDEGKKLLSLEKLLNARVVGQTEVIKTLVDSLKRGRVGVADPNRPLGVFIFTGPTGVGKTELAKSLAEIFYDNSESLVRLDMSEFSEKFTSSRLIGSPPGYVGYNEGGELTEPVRRRPFSLVLLDEIEKAHPEIFNTLLQVFDDGQLTDSSGKRVDFKNTIVVMTSNLEAPLLGSFFKPEFLNRVDAVLEFKPLLEDTITKIAKLELSKISKRLAEKDVVLTFSDDVLSWLAKEGFDEAFGARPLRRLIEREIGTYIANVLLENPIAKEIAISLDNNKLRYVVI